MRNSLLLVMCVLLVWGSSDAVGADELPSLKSQKEKLNYAIGVETARNFKNKGVDFDLNMVLKGMQDGIAGGAVLLPEKELRSILISVQSDLRRKESAANRIPGGQEHRIAIEQAGQSLPGK